MDNIYLKPGTFALLLWDFNAHYDSEDALLSSDFGICLNRWMECNSLFQIISEPTRITAQGATLLDLIITNYPGYFVNSGTLSPPSNCDHSLVYPWMNISLVKQKCYTGHILDLSKVDVNTPNWMNCEVGKANRNMNRLLKFFRRRKSRNTCMGKLYIAKELDYITNTCM